MVTPGGEASFVSRMFVESLRYRLRCRSALFIAEVFNMVSKQLSIQMVYLDAREDVISSPDSGPVA